MGSFKEFKALNRTFWENFWKYSQIIILVELSINLIVIPILNVLTNSILDLGNVNYISYTNILNLMTSKPLVILGLLLILLLILILIFSQFTLLLTSFQAIKSHANLRWRDYFKNVFKNVYQLSFRGFGFFLLYFLIVLPIGDIGFYSNLLNKVKIPEFIIEWIFTEHFYYGAILVILYFVIFYIGLRWLFVLPAMIFENKTIKQSITYSWRKTKNQTVHYLVIFLIIITIVPVIFEGLLFLIIGLQWLIDKIPFIRFPMAVINMTLVQIINYAASIYGTSIAALIILSRTKTTYFESHQENKVHKWFWALLAAGILFSFMSYNTVYFKGWLLERPVTISHRGVDDGNGVQNSLPALRKTAKEKPTYVEMDIQETKDHQYVVFHDNTLNGLAGINKRPSQLTLSQLKKIKIHENGQTAYIASFDDYLAESTKLHQKLLIEYKDVNGNSSNFVKKFAHKYNHQLQHNGDMVHSLDYNYIQESKKYMPHVPASYILSFNLSGVPKTHADAFTMEYTTLNSTFIDESHAINKKVFAWTVNSPSSMDQMIFLDVDGIITDNLSDLKQEIKNNFDEASYSTRIFNYVVQMQSPF
ncbi:glycerophosphoryl diester phosphodiesterase membrane domain-containing protein [Companilactobacillus baiquanensis]|uniref:Glycerophosphoryl diester phosphodiesterase membrane domain-containing protein n=1 Tax=Companilactobacillus baiquanensis TaxID=2486005 RepID=A0ABW1UWM0_9LACO|nr:glycerophosphodiester phosphodiesterase [Companilactobacillus baiquanensis]